MTTAECRSIEHAGLTWRKLAAGATVTERDVFRWRVAGPGRTRPVHGGIVPLARDLPAGDGSRDHDGGEG